MDNAVDKVVVNQILANLLFRAAAIHDAREADDSRRTVGRQPCQRVHDKGQVRFGFRGQHTGRGETRVVNQDRVIIAFPFDRIGRVADNDLKGFLVPMLGRNQRILMRNIEFVKINIVQEHIDTAQVVGRQVDFLPEEALPDVLFAQNLRRF